jgi:type I restriction enzyme, S subunit
MGIKIEYVELGNFISHKKNFIVIDDDKEYKLCRVKTKVDGVVIRGKKKGIDIKTKEQQICQAGDLIFAEMDARFGGYGIIPKELDEAIVSSHYFLYEIDTNKMRPAFLNYLLQLPTFHSQVQAQGSTNYAAIRPHHVLSYKIPYTSISEQDQLIERLQRVQNNIIEVKDLRLQQQKEIRNLIYSKYLEIIEDAHWDFMSDVAPIIRREVEINENNFYPELGIKSFGKGTFHKEPLSGFDVGTKKLFQIKTGDLLFSNVFAWEGAIAVAKEEDNDRFGSHRFISCDVYPDKAVAAFLCYHFLTPQGLEDINKASPGGAGRNKTLGLNKLMNIKVPVPLKEKQEEFSAFQQKMLTVSKYHFATLKELDELFPSLLDKAFKGEL